MWKLRFPFRPIDQVSGLQGRADIPWSGGTAYVELSDPYLVLSLEGFETEQAAQGALPYAWSVVALTSVRSRMGFSCIDQLDTVVYAEDPDAAGANLERMGLRNVGPVHGLVNGNWPAAVPVDKNIRYATAGDLTVVTTSSADSLVDSMSNLLAHGDPTLLFHDERFRLAAELWMAHYQEKTSRAKFLTLVTAIEILAPPVNKHPKALQLLDSWRRHLKELLESCQSGSEEEASYEALERELFFRREQSIRGRVRSYVRDTLMDSRPEEYEELARAALFAYDLRSKLVHDGTLERSRLASGYEAATRVLGALLESAVR